MLLNTHTVDRALVVPVERRRNHRMRQRFDSALELLRPILNQAGELQGAKYFRALSKLHNTFPDMSQNELEALVVSVVRTLNTR